MLSFCGLFDQLNETDNNYVFKYLIFLMKVILL